MIADAKPDMNAQAGAMARVKHPEGVSCPDSFSRFHIRADGFQTHAVSTIGGDGDHGSVHHPPAEAHSP